VNELLITVLFGIACGWFLSKPKEESPKLKVFK
jgi:hypothetical protein